MKIAVLAAAAFVLLGCSGCGNMVAKTYGGTINIDLPVGEKLAEVTWKDILLVLCEKEKRLRPGHFRRNLTMV